MKSGTRSRPAPLGRRKPSVAARIRPFWILASLAAVALAAVAIWFVRAPAFRIAHVGVSVPLGSPVTSDEVRRAAAIGPGTQSVAARYRCDRAADRGDPVRRYRPRRRTQVPRPQVALSITVRRPSACLRAADRVVTIDTTARVLQDGCAMPAAPRISAGTASAAGAGREHQRPGLGAAARRREDPLRR
jgi:hypothetical protein